MYLADGGTVCAFVLCCAVGVACVGLRLLFACCLAREWRVLALVYVDIYLYTDGVARDCGAFSCSCGGVSVG